MEGLGEEDLRQMVDHLFHRGPIDRFSRLRLLHLLARIKTGQSQWRALQQCANETWPSGGNIRDPLPADRLGPDWSTLVRRVELESGGETTIRQPT